MNQETRTEISDIIANFIIKNYKDCAPEKGDMDKAAEILPTLTDDQLWRLYYSFVRNERTFRIINNSDHLGITFAGIYVGIEENGYAHS